MVSLFNDPKQLIREDKILDFWPTKNQMSAERINATARFIVYATCIVYLIRRDQRILILGLTGLSVLYVMEKSNMIKELYVTDSTGDTMCQLPTKDNPMGNVLMSDYTDNPNKLPACDYTTVKDRVDKKMLDRIPYGPQKSRSPWPEQQRNALARQFVSTPVTDIPGDQTGFAEWLYGAKQGPLCRTDSRYCDPDARGVQLEAFGGLQPNGDKRSGMIRGSSYP